MTQEGIAADAARVAQALRAFHATGATRPLDYRLAQLRALREALVARESEFLDALHADLGKPRLEAYATELGLVLSNIDYALGRVARWMRPRRCGVPLLVRPARATVCPEPYGAVLIIGPWNYPLQLLLSPLVSAIAAGNCVCLKPSELAPATSAAVSRMLRSVFPSDYVAVVEGAGDTAEALIGQGFDYLFFTGSTSVGRKVMESAARCLTPVTLELGGKSPCIVCADADSEVTARRILWGKLMNAGQTCVAPDHVLVDERAMGPLLDAMGRVLREFLGDSPRSSPDYGRIVNRRHFDRLAGCLGHGRVVHGGDHDVDTLFIAPTVMTDVDAASPLATDEIFGPILPVMPFADIQTVLDDLRGRPAPLALYLFTRDRAIQQRVPAATRSGGVCINDTMSHLMCKELPFGGVGASGMGSYHGKAGFDCFTHYRSVLRRSLRPDPRLRYPPARVSLDMLRRVYRFLLRR